MILSRLEMFLRMKTVPIRYKLNTFLFNNTNFNKLLKGFKDENKNKPMVVVANGPSLNRTPISLLTKYKTIGLNKINLFF